jgi:hypothetical protein
MAASGEQGQDGRASCNRPQVWTGLSFGVVAGVGALVVAYRRQRVDEDGAPARRHPPAHRTPAGSPVTTKPTPTVPKP